MHIPLIIDDPDDILENIAQTTIPVSREDIAH